MANYQAPADSAGNAYSASATGSDASYSDDILQAFSGGQGQSNNNDQQKQEAMEVAKMALLA